MFPEIPADLEALSIDELDAFAEAVRLAAKPLLADPKLSAEDFATVEAAMASRTEALAISARKTKQAKLSDDTADPEPEPEPDPEPEPEADPDATVTDPEADGAASSKKVKVQTGFGLSTTTVEKPKGRNGRIEPDRLTASDGVPGMKAGASFESWAELAAKCVERSSDIRKNSDEKHTVASVFADYPEDRRLTDDHNWNMSRFERDEVMAALCAPATPYYDLACANTLRRPVFNSLPQFQAPRGKVSIMSSPLLSDITTGVGIWSAANEAATNAVKSACQTITCNTPTEFQIYGVYRCLTVRNLLAMTYPELVEAWLNRLGAAHARLAEINLLNAMGTAATSITAPLLGYGASTTITSTILNYIALYQETQRWDITDNLEAWLPRWVRTGMKMDMVRRRTTNGNFQTVPSDAAIDAMFRDVGVNPHWFIDTPTWSTAIPSVASANVLNRLPADVSILLAPPGKLAVMDRGELAIGVTGNGIYRDNNSNSRNEFTFFFENFEGIVNTDTCPAHILTIPVCYNGTQADDVVMNCQGGDEGGYQS